MDVSIPGTSGRKLRAGIHLHRCQSLLPSLITRKRSIPVTTPARTIADLSRITRSELERRFLLLCRRHHLLPPEVNIRIAGLLVDFAWIDRRLIVETDGFKFHRGRAAFENDKARDLRLREHGFDVMHLSYRQVLEKPEQVANLLRRELSQGPLPASGSQPAR